MMLFFLVIKNIPLPNLTLDLRSYLRRELLVHVHIFFFTTRKIDNWICCTKSKVGTRHSSKTLCTHVCKEWMAMNDVMMIPIFQLSSHDLQLDG